MLEQFIQSPYIVLPWGLAKAALIITVLYICVLVAFIVHGEKKDNLKITVRSISKMKQGDKNKVVIFIFGFVIMVVMCIVLPSFFEDDNAILKISNAYLQYETLIFIGVFLFLFTAFLNKSNCHKQITASNRILNILIWISISTSVFSGQMDYTNWKNIIVLICAWGISNLFLFVDIKSVERTENKIDRFDRISYNPVQSVNELFPQHKQQAEDIADVIYKSSPEPFSICVSGKWGTGKTSVVYGVIDILNKIEGFDCDFIHINALELDNKKAMISYLFSQIKEKLKSRGVYVGIDSELSEFISSSAGTLTSSSIGTYIQKKFFYRNDDYRYQKKELEQVLQQAYKNGKLIVIIDDIERCDKTLAREYLFLIKEIATMKSCVSVFITDYDILKILVSAESKDQELLYECDFLSKFFNFRIDLRDEQLDSVFEFYDHYIREDDPSLQIIYKLMWISPKRWYQDVTSGINNKLEQEKDNKRIYYSDEEKRELSVDKIKSLESHLSLIYSWSQNFRNVAKFYNVFRQNIIKYCDLMGAAINELETQKYIKSRNVGHILFILSFVEIFAPIEYQQLMKRGVEYLESPLYGTNDSVNENRALLIEITEGMIYGGYSDYHKTNVYIKQDIRRFINTFLNNKNELPKLINSFDSQDEKWITAIKNSDAQEMCAHWDDMISMILQKNPYIHAKITNEWRSEMFDKLLDFAEQQIERGEWSSDRVFSIFSSKMKNERLFAVGTGMIKTFWEHLEKSEIYQKPAADLVEEIKVFPYHYTYNRMGYMYRLAHYLILDVNDNKDTESLQEYMLNINKNFGENISAFLDNIVQYIPKCTLTQVLWIEKYKEFANIIVDYLSTQDLTQFPDVNNEIDIMIDSIDEFSSLENIIAWLDSVDTVSFGFSSDFRTDNVEQVINYFEEIFASFNQENQRYVERLFGEYFRWLQCTQDLVISKQQIDRLQKLVTIYIENFGYSSMPYRRMLLSISANQTNTGKSAE